MIPVNHTGLLQPIGNEVPQGCCIVLRITAAVRWEDELGTQTNLRKPTRNLLLITLLLNPFQPLLLVAVLPRNLPTVVLILRWRKEWEQEPLRDYLAVTDRVQFQP